MSRAMFGPSKTLQLTSSRAGQPPRADQAHSHDSISLGRLPGRLLPLSSPVLQKSSESAGYSHGSPGRCPILLWKKLVLKSGSGIFTGMTYSSSLSPSAEMAASPGSLVAHFLLGPLTCQRPWTDLGVAGIVKTKIVIWRKRQGSLKACAYLWSCVDSIYLLL